MASQHDTKRDEKEIDYRKPTRVNRKKGREKKVGSEPRVRGEAYHRERFDGRRAAAALMDDDDLT
jgi:IS5 family transposase